MSDRQMRVKKIESGDASKLEFEVSRVAPSTITRVGKYSCRSVPGSKWKRLRVAIDDRSAKQILTAQDLFINAMRDRWGDWFQPDQLEMLDEAAEPVVAINHRDERTATLLVEGSWPADDEEASLRLMRAVFDGEGLAVVWMLMSCKDAAEEQAEKTAEAKVSAKKAPKDDAAEAPAEKAAEEKVAAKKAPADDAAAAPAAEKAVEEPIVEKEAPEEPTVPTVDETAAKKARKAKKAKDAKKALKKMMMEVLLGDDSDSD